MRLIEKFENLTIESFNHEAHVRLTWLYLQELPVPEVLIKLRDGLKRLTKVLGVEGKYHETITFTYVFLIATRLAKEPEASWEHFQAQNKDLFGPVEQLMSLYYSQEQLNEPLAKTAYVFPTKNVGLPCLE